MYSVQWSSRIVRLFMLLAWIGLSLSVCLFIFKCVHLFGPASSFYDFIQWIKAKDMNCTPAKIVVEFCTKAAVINSTYNMIICKMLRCCKCKYIRLTPTHAPAIQYFHFIHPIELKLHELPTNVWKYLCIFHIESVA